MSRAWPTGAWKVEFKGLKFRLVSLVESNSMHAWAHAIGCGLRWVPSGLNLGDPGSHVCEVSAKPISSFLRHLIHPPLGTRPKGKAAPIHPEEKERLLNPPATRTLRLRFPSGGC